MTTSAATLTPDDQAAILWAWGGGGHVVDIAADLDLPVPDVRAALADLCGFDRDRARQIAAAQTPTPQPTPDTTEPAPQPVEPTHATAADFLAAGISYRQLDYWTSKGYLDADQATPGSGRSRTWPLDEVGVARRILRLTDAGLELQTAIAVARGQTQLGPGISITITDDGQEVADG